MGTVRLNLLKETTRRLALLCLVLLGAVAVYPASAGATCAICTNYQTSLSQEIQKHENWMTNTWWGNYVEPALKKVSDEVRNALLFDAATFGAYLDAEDFSNSMLAIQDLSATTLKNYQLSDTICKFGTLSRSLAASELKGKANQLSLNQSSQNRQLGQFGHSAASGAQEDQSARLVQFRADFCDPTDFGTGMSALCNGTAPDTRQDIDISFTRAVDIKKTLEIDFSDGTKTDDEANVIALAHNLYGHKVFDRIMSDDLKDKNKTDVRSTYLDQRAVVAKRGVAENSFNALVGQKSLGLDQSKAYMTSVLKNLGFDTTYTDKYLGTKPSYDAQMEILTKRLYQDPQFYANLMESPANVSRQYTAMQAFGLMQKRDIFETITRSEMLLSLILEMEIGKYQDDLQNNRN